MSPRAQVPDATRRSFSAEHVARRADYGPSTHPRKLDPSADAQAILDRLVNDGQGGIPERVAYDGGFRVGAHGTPHAHKVVDALAATADHFAQLGQQLGRQGQLDASRHYGQLAGQIGAAQVTYAETVKNYWSGQTSTPPDIAGRLPAGELGPTIGRDGRPVE